MKKIVIVWSTALAAAAAIACSGPASPSANGATGVAASAATSTKEGTPRIVTDDLSGVSVTTPALTTPSDGQIFKYADQPVTLVVKNALTTGSAALTYT